MLNLRLLSLLGLYKSPEYDYWRFETLGQLCTPNERVFWDTGYFELSKVGELWPQYIVAHYRLDFALIRVPDAPQLKVAIEIDDQASHSSQGQRAYDTERERYLQRHGWTVVRFTASQLVKDAPACIRETAEIVNETLKWLKVR
jgi:very-short-patch-repair endonuclease